MAPKRAASLWNFRCPRAIRHRLQHRHRSLSNGAKTYYDSQSGLHVPIHNENDIFVYKHWTNSYLQLYKNSDDAFAGKEELEALSTWFDGVFLTFSMNHPRDERNLETISHIAPTSKDFTFFAPPLKANDIVSPNFVVMCNYSETTPDELRKYKQRSVRTTITLSDSNTNTEEPFELANQIATLMDESGGGNYVFVSFEQQDDDYILGLCEELSYLDVPGPIMKSRLILDCQPEISEDLVDEVMSLGVNKFVVYEQQQVQDCIQAVAEEQGKQLSKAPSES